MVRSAFGVHHVGLLTACFDRTANPLKLIRAQQTTTQPETNTPNSGTSDYAEEADRALRAVNRKLDQSLSVEYTGE